MRDSTERYLVPGERRSVDVEIARKFRAHASKIAAELGLDKVTAAVILIDWAVELVRSNATPTYSPEHLREVLERAILVHFGSGGGN